VTPPVTVLAAPAAEAGTGVAGPGGPRGGRGMGGPRGGRGMRGGRGGRMR